MKEIIISDTSPLIILIKSNRFYLLENIVSKIIIPQKVYYEIKEKKDKVFDFINSAKNIEKKDIKNEKLFLELTRGSKDSPKLDDGESEAIVLAKELDLFLFIDEKKGLRVSKLQNVDTLTMFTLLNQNIKNKFIDKKELLEILEDFEKVNFKLKANLELDLLREI